MQHMLSRGRSADQMFSLATLGAVTMLLYLSQTMSTFAEQLVALGQERAQVSDRTTTNTVAMPKESAPIRKSHKLIRKSAPVASVQLNDITTSSTTSTSLKAPTAAPTETTATQVQSKDATALSPTTSSTLAPVKSSITTTTSTTSFSLAGALSSPTSSTLSGMSSLAGVAVSGSSAVGDSTNGRGMKKLSAAMPGLTQLLTCLLYTSDAADE